MVVEGLLVMKYLRRDVQNNRSVHEQEGEDRTVVEGVVMDQETSRKITLYNLEGRTESPYQLWVILLPGLQKKRNT